MLLRDYPLVAYIPFNIGHELAKWCDVRGQVFSGSYACSHFLRADCERVADVILDTEVRTTK